jgi:hypothetical protein
MKHQKSVTQTYIERDRKVLPELIRRAKHQASYPTSANKLYHIAAELPTDKFYIGDDAACEYIRKRFLHQVHPKFISPYKQRLFDALYDEVVKMKESEKYRSMGLKDVTLLALGHQAPCVGLTPYIIGLKIFRQRKHAHHAIAKSHKKHE